MMEGVQKLEFYQNLGGIDTKKSTYSTEDGFFLDLRNFGFERPGALVSRPGTEVWTTLSSSFIQPSSLYQYTKLNGESFVFINQGQTMYSRGASFFCLGASLIFESASDLTLALQSVSVGFDFETYGNFAYFANGFQFKISNGNEAWFYDFYDTSQPQSPIVAAGVSAGLTFRTNASGATHVIASGDWIVALNPVRGFSSIYEGPFFPFQLDQGQKRFISGEPSIQNTNIRTTVGSTIVSQGFWQVFGLTILQGFGVSAIHPALVRVTDGLTLFRSATPASWYLTTIGGVTNLALDFAHLTTSTGLFDEERSSWVNKTPKYLALIHDKLFVAGISAAPMAVYYSQTGRADLIEPDSFFEYRSGDGEPITGIETFREGLLVFKSSSVGELSGNNEENFVFRELTDEYGLVNDRAKVVFENRCWFMDLTGIIEFDGANFRRVSDPLREYLDSVDKTKAYAFHVKERREVWFCVDPVVFVWNYYASSWSIFDRLEIDNLKAAGFVDFAGDRRLTFFDGLEGVRFGASLTTDRGQAITLVAQSKFHKRLENTTQELWRRLYSNFDVAGSSLVVTAQLLPNYGSSVYASQQFNLSQFQKRLEFGVSSRSLSVRWVMESSERVKFNGYALESRFLRKI